MAQKDLKDLKKFLKPFHTDVQGNALWLREFVWDLYPQCNELIYDAYNALAFGWSPTDRLRDTFCTIGVYEKYVHFGFYWGSEIADPKKILLGNGKQYRYIIVSDLKEFPIAYMKKLLREAYANSMAKIKMKEEVAGPTGETIVKSVYPVKRRPAKKTKGKTSR